MSARKRARLRVAGLLGAVLIPATLLMPAQVGGLLTSSAALPSPLPGGPPIPNPTIPPVGPEPGTPAAPCSFRGLGANEIRQIYSLPTVGGPGSVKKNSYFGVDPAGPCHIYRSLQHELDRSDDSGATFNDTYNDNSGTNGPIVISAPATAPNKLYFYDQTGKNGVFFSPDYGATWVERDKGLFNVSTAGPTDGIVDFQVAPSDSNTIYLIGEARGQSLLYGTSDGGNQWNVLTPPTAALTTIAIDPTNPRHVIASGGAGQLSPGGQVTPVDQTGVADVYWESSDGGNTWASHPGPSSNSNGQPPLKLWITHPQAGIRIFAIQMQVDPGGSGKLVDRRVFKFSSTSGSWTPLIHPGGLNAIIQIAFNPSAQDDIVMAVGSADQIGNDTVLIGSVDGFATQPYHHTLSAGTKPTDLQFTADKNGNYFLQRTLGGATDELDAFRMTALYPPPVDKHHIPPRAYCLLQAAQPPAPNPLQPTRQPKPAYTAGSIAFDGQLLYYTMDNLAPGLIYRLNPVNCDKSLPPLRVTDTSGKLITVDSLAFDPRYEFRTGETGAVLARGATGQEPRVPQQSCGLPPPCFAPVYAVDPSGRAASELVMSILCDQGDDARNCNDPNTFAYDPFRDQLWANVDDPADPGFSIPGLVDMPQHALGVALPATHPNCFSDFLYMGDDTPSDMVIGANNIAYVQGEDDETVYRLDISNPRKCRIIDSFKHDVFVEGDPAENDQMACDPVTFGSGGPLAGGRPSSVLWIRNVSDPPGPKNDGDPNIPGNAVMAFDIPDGFCPVPTTLTMDKVPEEHPGHVNHICAYLEVAGSHIKLANQPVQFEFIGKIIGTSLTDKNGQACIDFTTPDAAGANLIFATFPGSHAYLPSDTNTLFLISLIKPEPVFPQIRIFPPPPVLVPPPAPVPATALQGQAQAQSQAQAQAQAQPGLMADQEAQTQVTVQTISGPKRASANAMRHNGPPLVAALVVQLIALAMFGTGLYYRDRWLKHRLPRLAFRRINRG